MTVVLLGVVLLGVRSGSPTPVPNPGPSSEAAEAQAFRPGAAGLRHLWLSDAPHPAVTVVPNPDGLPRLRRHKGQAGRGAGSAGWDRGLGSGWSPASTLGALVSLNLQGFHSPFAQHKAVLLVGVTGGQPERGPQGLRVSPVATPFHSGKEHSPHSLNFQP